MAIGKIIKNALTILILLVVLGLIGFESICRDRSVKYSAFSENKETAIKEGFYINTYLPAQTSIVISNSKDTIRFDSAWSEHSWQMERRFGLCLCEHKIKGDFYNFCIPFSTTTSDINSYPFEFKQLKVAAEPYYDPGSYFGNRFNFGLSTLSDTLKITFSQKYFDANTTPFLDTLSFIKVK